VVGAHRRPRFLHGDGNVLALVDLDEDHRRRHAPVVHGGAGPVEENGLDLSSIASLIGVGHVSLPPCRLRGRGQPASIAVRHSSTMARARSSSARLMVSGGVSVRTLPALTLKLSPRSSARYITRSASSLARSRVLRSRTSSIPRRSPSPRTSPI